MIARLIGRLVALLVAARSVFRRSRSAHAAPGAGVHAPPPTHRDVPGNRRAETLVAALLFAAAVLGFGFTAVYVAASDNTQLLGVALGGSLLLLATAAIVAGKAVVPQETAVEDRGKLLEEDEVEEIAENIEEGGQGISRRVLLAGAGGVAGAAIVTAAATPLASLGPRLTGIHATPWHAGVGLVDEQGNPLAAADIQIGSFYTALPEGGDWESFGAGLLVVKLPSEQIHVRREWAPDGVLAYSKICTHAGCAISLYRYPTFGPTTGVVPAFTCPCHYSSFAPGDGGAVIFGPAGRPLPQLPLTIDASGNLRAAGGFDEDIGPAWFDVRRT